MAILRPQLGEDTIVSLLPILFSSEYGYTLCEKMSRIALNRKDSYFRKAYRDVNPEYHYGHLWKNYLVARKVENLRCEENEMDHHECTLYWTETERFILTDHDSLKQVRDKRDEQYTHSIQTEIEEALARQAKAEEMGRSQYGL